MESTQCCKAENGNVKCNWKKWKEKIHVVLLFVKVRKFSLTKRVKGCINFSNLISVKGFYIH